MYVLSGYFSNYVPPEVKVFGLFNTDIEAINEMSDYVNLWLVKAKNEVDGEIHIRGNNYTLWITNIGTNDNLWEVNGLNISNGGQRVRIIQRDEGIIANADVP